ncbi:MAG: AsmA family protein [Rhodocyclaceae bacterium]|nr:AsmA family protein [Rhodocyclaceae bacterium]
MALFTNESVLVRTEEGEAAARQPRRVASNRARAALLLLDGQLSVGEMKRRFGESLEVEEALMELLRDGLAVDRDDAVTDLEEEIEIEDRLVPQEEPPTEPPPDPEVSIPPGFSLAGRTPTEAPMGPVVDDMAPIELPPDRLTEGRLGSDQDVDASIGAAYGENRSGKKRKKREATRRRDADGPSTLVLLLDRLRFQLLRLFRGVVMLGIAAVIGVLLVILWHAPEWFRGEIETEVRAVAGTDVVIESMHPGWDGGPVLRLGGLAVGEGEQAMQISQVDVKPDWHALGRLGSAALSLRLSGIEGSPSRLASLFNRADFSHFEVKRIAVSGLRVQFAEGLAMHLDGVGEVEYGALQRLDLLAADGKGIRYRVPLPLSFPIELSGTAESWEAPFLRGMTIESLQFDGLLYDEGIRVLSAGGALYGGRYGGRLEIAWQQEPVALAGEMQLEGLRLERLMPALRKSGDLEGGLNGTLELAAEAERFEGLGEAMSLNSRVEIENGRFGGLDVGAIMRERGNGVVRGGATRFDSMKLDVSMNMGDRALKAAIRRFDAGNLHVGGGLQITPDDELTGRLTSTLATGERRVSLPVVVSGTLGSPALRLAPEARQ